MFYLTEIYFRILYSFFSFCFLVFIFFLKKEILLLIYNFNILKNLFDDLILFNTIVYNSPLELFSIYFSLALYSTIVYFIPYFLWSISDFSKSAINSSRFKLVNFLWYFNIIILIVLLLFFFYTIYPQIWNFFYILNKTFENGIFFNFFYQLQFSKYFKFLKDCTSLFLFCYLFFLSCGLISFIFKLNFLIQFRKGFIALNACLATLLSPPDLLSQILLFILLNWLTESLILFFIFLIKYNFITANEQK